MMSDVLQFVPVAVWVTVIGVYGKLSRRLGRTENQWESVLANTGKCELELGGVKERLSNIEGQLKRMNGDGS